MREIRTSGSEGGGTGYSTGPPYPYQGSRIRDGEPPRQRLKSRRRERPFHPFPLFSADYLLAARLPYGCGGPERRQGLAADQTATAGGKEEVT